MPNQIPTSFQLCFVHGQLDENNARNIAPFLLSYWDKDIRPAVQEEALNTYLYLSKAQEKYLQLSCDHNQLISSLKSTRSIAIKHKTYPFGECSDSAKMLLQLWEFPAARLLPRTKTIHCMSTIMFAISDNNEPVCISKLKHDRLPLEYFAASDDLIRSTAMTFTRLTILDLVIDFSANAADQLVFRSFFRLAYCLRKTQSLCFLRIAFDGRKPDLQGLLPGHQTKLIIPNLREIRLEGVVVSQTRLGRFLSS